MRWSAQARIDAGPAGEQRHAAMHASVGTGDARNGQRDVLDPPHVLAGEVQVEHPFRDLDLAAARRPQLHVFDGEMQAQ